MHWAEYNLRISWDAKHNILHFIEIASILEKMKKQSIHIQNGDSWLKEAYSTTTTKSINNRWITSNYVDSSIIFIHEIILK